MRDYIKEHSNALTEAENVYVIDYSHPATLINGKTAVFLHGPKVKSPMGGHLAAFANKADATIQQGTLGGDIITWDQMLATE
jgi:nitrous oxide reductase accessory protein NosL